MASLPDYQKPERLFVIDATIGHVPETSSRDGAGSIKNPAGLIVFGWGRADRHG
jgi:hypothetical protein